MPELIDVYEIYRYCKEGEDADALHYDNGNSKPIKQVCRIINGSIIFLEDGFLLRKNKEEIQ